MAMASAVRVSRKAKEQTDNDIIINDYGGGGMILSE